jgi:hypothetical protein
MIESRAPMIDELMEKASKSLLDADYFAVERHAKKALAHARKCNDFERMARVILPLQEARRQRRHEAADSGLRLILTARPGPRDLLPGMYLVQPPLVGIDARTIREQAEAAGTPIVIVCREPMTRTGRWPVVAVGTGSLTMTLTLRTQIQPPPGVEPRESGMTRDIVHEPPPAAWFQGANEALGDHAIAQIKPSDPPAWRVDDLMEALDALPDHEKLHQALAAACREAQGVPLPEVPRRKSRHDNPRSF